MSATKKRWAKADWQLAQKMRADGKTHAVIASALGRTLSSVQAKFTNAGLKKFPMWTELEIEKGRRMRFVGLSYVEIALALGNRTPRAVEHQANTCKWVIGKGYQFPRSYSPAGALLEPRPEVKKCRGDLGTSWTPELIEARKKFAALGYGKDKTADLLGVHYRALVTAELAGIFA